MKKTLAALLAALMVLSLAACGGNAAPAATTAAPATEAAAAATEAPAAETPAKVYNIGICQQVTHDALDAATKGFQDALVEALGADNVKFDLQNAAGDSNTCSNIANSFVSNGVDLIMANATSALQAAAAATADIPVLGTSVTEYGVALGIEDFNGTPGGNVSGTSDLAPLEDQAKMLQTWFPDAKNVALLYCSAEPNSKYQVDTVEGYLTEMGYTCKQFAFVDSNDMPAVSQEACDYCDVLYVPTDNMVASSTEVIDGIFSAAGKPIIAGEEGICKGCGVASLSISYYDLGRTTGEMAAKILKGEADVSTMAVEYAPATPKYNADICAKLGLTPPEGYEPIG